MATRFYLPPTASGIPPPITPAPDAGWEKFSNVVRVTTQTQKRRIPTAGSGGTANGVSGTDTINRQFISAPLRAQTIAGTVKGMIRVAEVAATDNFNAAFVARIIAADGTTVRGTLLAAFGGGTEFPTTASSIKFPPAWVAPGTSLSSVDAQEGDFLVFEIGLNQTSTSVAAGSFNLGDDQTSDYSETEGVGAGFNPWIEFSQDLNFQQQFAPESFYYSPIPQSVVGNPYGYAFFTLPPPVTAADVTVVVGATALATGSAPTPIVDVQVPVTPATALGVTPAPTVIIDSGVTVVVGPAIALGATPAPQVLVTVPTTSATATGSSPASVALVRVSPAAALAQGSTVAPVSQVVKAVTAALAAGSSPAPVVNVVVPIGAATALGITPAPSVIIAGNVVVTVSAALALGSAPTPVVQVLKQATAANAAGSTISPAVLIASLATAATAQGVTPTPTVIAGVLLIAAAVGIVDQETATLALTSLVGDGVTVTDATGSGVTVTDASGTQTATQDLAGDGLTITDQTP